MRRGRSSVRRRTLDRPQRLREASERIIEQPDEINRIAPGVRLLHPLRARELDGQRREHRLRTFPAGDVKGLESLVDEIERVAAVEVAVVRRRGEEHVRQLSRGCARPGRRDEGTLGTLCIAHLDEAAEPTRQVVYAPGNIWEWIELEPRWLARRVGGDVGDPVMEGGGAIGRLQPRHEVHEAGKGRQPSEPTAPAPCDAEIESGAERLHARRVGR